MRLSARLSASCTPGQRRRIEVAAARSGCTVAAFLRRAARAECRRVDLKCAPLSATGARDIPVHYLREE